MSNDRTLYWIAQLVDPREHDRLWASMFSSLAFMPETLVLNDPDLCFFRASGRVPSECVVIGASRGTDTLDHTTVAGHRVDDASAALSLTLHSEYSTKLLSYALDALAEEFLPGSELFRQPSYGRCPPLSPEAAARTKTWYAALQGARPRRNNDPSVEQVVTMSIDAFTTHDKFKGVKLYAAFEELCSALGGNRKAKVALGFSERERNRIELGRRPVAHGGAKGKTGDARSLSEIQAEAAQTFSGILLRFLEAVR